MTSGGSDGDAYRTLGVVQNETIDVATGMHWDMKDATTWVCADLG